MASTPVSNKLKRARRSNVYLPTMVDGVYTQLFRSFTEET